MRPTRFVLFAGALISLLCALACSGGSTDQGAVTPTPEKAGGPVYSPSGNEGNIKGSIAFKGTTPDPRKIQMGSDPVCEQKAQGATFEDMLVKDGKLANVFVYVKSGLPENTFPAPSTEVVLDQVGCRYVPHVFGLQTNQTLKILNSDATAHNVHPVPKNNREWNENQYPSAPPLTKKFAEPDLLIPIKCNQHSWMKAYAGVLRHPFFAVSGADGSFAITGLPPGEYEVEAWHEKLGTKVGKVTVKEKADVDLAFEFDQSAISQASSLKVQPALVVP